MHARVLIPLGLESDGWPWPLVQLQKQGITDVGLIAPAETFAFFRKGSFNLDRENSAPMQLGSLLKSPVLRTDVLQAKLLELLSRGCAESA